MDWNRQVFEPQRPPPKRPDLFRYPSPPLCRFCGSIAGIGGGLLVLYGSAALFGIDPEFMRMEGAWGLKEVSALLVSLVALLICGLIGFGIGGLIDVVSEKTNYFLSVLWHYFANGSLIWFFLLGLVLTKILGKVGVKSHFDQIGLWYSTFSIFGTCTVGSVAIAGFLIIAGKLKADRKPKFLPCLFFALPLSISMGYFQFRLLGLPGHYWVIIGILFALALVPISAGMVARDVSERRKLLSIINKEGG
jgi:hypothetical protein